MQTFFERGSQKWPVHTAGDITHVILNNCNLENIEEPYEEGEQTKRTWGIDFKVGRIV